MNKYITIHGHFYQPPRENPWLEYVELQDSAYPYHDWNARVTAECYAPNATSRILSADRKIVDIVNNYSRMSFNFGPTLLSWLAQHDPDVYNAVLEADRVGMNTHFSGHGPAIAQAYNHMIMPLASARDKRTQVLWGIYDFERRFIRKPEGMWLPETAVDTATLEALAENGILFTILAPHQAGHVRPIGGGEWTELAPGSIDPKMAYRCVLPSGRSIVLFFYDGPVAHDVAFGNVLGSGVAFARRMTSLFRDDDTAEIEHIAADGETFGHHHRFGDMALAYCLYFIEKEKLGRITIYGEFLEKHPPTHEVRIVENSSWSCAHGVERWKNDCGCMIGGHEGWNQKWRAPLRHAMDWLRDNAAAVFEERMKRFAGDPWKARDGYIQVVMDRSEANVDSFLEKISGRKLKGEDRIEALKLLEIQRAAMLMYTSCAWFFDDISGIEATQVLRYAARVMQLVREVSGAPLEDRFVKMLAEAPSNVESFGSGARVYELLVRPGVIDLVRVGAHYAVSSLFKDYPDEARIDAYTAFKLQYEKKVMGKRKLAMGSIRVRSDITSEENCTSFVVMHMGDQNLIGGAREYQGDRAFESMKLEVSKAFDRGDIPGIVRLMDRHFREHNYSLWHLFRDSQRDILTEIFEAPLKNIEASFRQIYESHYPMMQAVEPLSVPVPRYFSHVLEFILNMDIRRSLENDEDMDIGKLRVFADEARKW
ncbi:MAG: DUF3536 domain-containing protein, partial [Candidatus Omnitrophota bacterium]